MLALRNLVLNLYNFVILLLQKLSLFNYFLSTAVSQSYDTHVNQEYVIRGNDVILKCGIPGFVADFVSVVSWHDNEGSTVLLGQDYSTQGNFHRSFSSYLQWFSKSLRPMSPRSNTSSAAMTLSSNVTFPALWQIWSLLSPGMTTMVRSTTGTMIHMVNHPAHVMCP